MSKLTLQRTHLLEQNRLALEFLKKILLTVN